MEDRGGRRALTRDAPSRRASNRDVLSRRAVALVGTVLVLIAGGAIAVRTVDLGAALAALREADPLLLTVAVAVYVLSWPIRGRRYADVLGAMNHRCGTGFLTGVVFLSQTANLAVPARAGDGIRAYLINARRGVPYATGAASLAVERVFDLVAIAALGGVALGWVLFAGGPTAVAADALVLGAVAVAIATLTLSVATVRIARSDRRFASALRDRFDGPLVTRVVDAACRFGGDVRVVAASPGALATIGVGSLAVWILDVLTAVLVLAAIGTELALPTLLTVGTLAVSVGNLAKVLPLSQGGIGLYEAAFTAIVVGVASVGTEPVLVAAVLDHALKNAVTLAGGGLAAILLNASPRTGSQKIETTATQESEANSA